jgi:hypothetical protein
MQLFENRQQKTLLISKAKSQLLEIQAITGKRNSEIAKDLGISYRTLYGLENENQFSGQLLRGLQLLLENIRLTARIEELENALRTVQGLAAPAAGYQLNENPVNYHQNAAVEPSYPGQDVEARPYRLKKPRPAGRPQKPGAVSKAK